MDRQNYTTTGVSPLKLSRDGKHRYRFLYLKRDDGKSYRTYLVPTYHNYRNWKYLVDGVIAGNRYVVTGLKVKNEAKKMIDADSTPRIIEKLESAEA